jgi:hypothetical protein
MTEHYSSTMQRYCLDPSCQRECGIKHSLAVSNRKGSKFQTNRCSHGWNYLKSWIQLNALLNMWLTPATLVQVSPALVDPFAKKYTSSLKRTKPWKSHLGFDFSSTPVVWSQPLLCLALCTHFDKITNSPLKQVHGTAPSQMKSQSLFLKGDTAEMNDSRLLNDSRLTQYQPFISMMSLSISHVQLDGHTAVMTVL